MVIKFVFTGKLVYIYMMAYKKKTPETSDQIMNNLHKKAANLKKRHADTNATMDRLNREADKYLHDKINPGGAPLNDTL